MSNGYKKEDGIDPALFCILLILFYPCLFPGSQ